MVKRKINLPIFRQELIVIIGETVAEVIQNDQKLSGYIDANQLINEEIFTFQLGKSYYIIMCETLMPTSVNIQSSLIASYVLEHIKCSFTESSKSVYAYLSAYIFNEILTTFEKLEPKMSKSKRKKNNFKVNGFGNK